MQVFLNGKFVPENTAKISINDHAFLYGDGIYETMRTYNGKVWQIDEHIERLFHSAKLTNIQVPWSKEEIKEWINELIKHNRNTKPSQATNELRLRLTITRGNNDMDFMNTKKPAILISSSTLNNLPQNKGLKLITFKDIRPYPVAKHTSQIMSILARQEALKQKKDDAVFVSPEGFVEEGAFSNIFIVKNEILKTPVLGEILGGLTRQFILSFANQIIETHQCEIKMEELYSADEIFLSLTTQGILWVSEIDGNFIGNGKIGKYTEQIFNFFQKRTKN